MPGYDTRGKVGNTGYYVYRSNNAMQRVDVPRFVEAKYSWRSYPRDNDALYGTQFGIPLPATRGSLTGIIASRREYLNAIGNSFAGANAPVKEPAQCLVNSTGDSGHHYRSMFYKTRRSAIYREAKVGADGTAVLTAMGAVDGLGAAPRLSWMTPFPAFPSTVVNPSGFPTSVQLQGTLNRIFRSMDPTKERSQIAETVISLLRGEFPRFYKNFREFFEAAASGKQRLRAVGGQYLNSQFGWKPLIDDMTRFIGSLIKIDALMYGSGYRRSRLVRYDDVVQQTTVAALGNLYGSSRTFPAAIGNLKPQTTNVFRFSTRLNARLVPVSRPGSKSNYHIERAHEELRKIGLWYPALGWDILPWSWLLDWVVDIGTGLSNAFVYNRTNGLVNIDFAWATHRLECLSETSFAQRSYRSGGLTPTVCDVRGVTTTLTRWQERVPASPFGFGIALDSLSSTQKQILVALGLARMR